MQEKQPTSRKSKIIILSVIAAIYLTILLSIFIPIVNRPSINKNETNFCYDYYDILSQEEENSINEIGSKIQKKYGINVYVATTERIYTGKTSTLFVPSNENTKYDYNNKNNYKADLWGENFLKNKNLSQSENCVVLIINARKYKIISDMKPASSIVYSGDKSAYEITYSKEDISYAIDYHFDIYTYGASNRKITDTELTRIIFGKNADNILLGGDLVTSATCSMMTELGKSYAWIYTNKWPSICIISLVISAAISITVIVLVSKSYSKKRKVVNFSLENNTNLELTEKNDVFLRRSVTYTVISTSSSNSSSSSGHSSGGIGGGGGGGGAGHRGGR